MRDRFARTRLLIGDAGIEVLSNARVAVIGLGGVGGYALEALARAGVGRLFLVDGDTVDVTNMNRQILALDNTVGTPKVDAARERVLAINPDARVETVQVFLSPENIDTLLPDDLGYAIDAIDTVDAKVYLIRALFRRNVRFVTCLGSANKLDPAGIQVADISRTRYCPLARLVRQRLRQCGIYEGVRCVYSEENLARTSELEQDGDRRKRINGTISYMPGLMGLTAAGVIINDILADLQPPKPRE